MSSNRQHPLCQVADCGWGRFVPCGKEVCPFEGGRPDLAAWRETAATPRQAALLRVVNAAALGNTDADDLQRMAVDALSLPLTAPIADGAS
jgi:hypothetical protein